MYVCFAASPIQLICFKEFVFKFKIDKYKIYILSSVDPNVNVQLKKTIDFLNLKNIENISRSSSKLIQFFQKYKFLLNLYKNHHNKNCIFVISDFRNTILHQIRIIFKKSKFILIDDGAQIYKYHREYFQENMYFPWRDFRNLLGKLKIFINYGFNLKYLINSNFEIFTIYGRELGLEEKNCNKFEYINNTFKLKSRYCESNVYFIGSKMAEQNYLTMEEELESIKKVKNYWENFNKSLIYVAKRTTSKLKINLIEKKIGINVITSDMPMELQFLNLNDTKVPKIICSFGSSVDKTFPMIYKNTQSYLIIINDLKKYQFFNNYFKLYEEIMFRSKLEDKIIRL
tara:strand:- start:318 stop:1346 length:1029 start_codon:yes stop_codon:yes gene_type:complete